MELRPRYIRMKDYPSYYVVSGYEDYQKLLDQGVYDEIFPKEMMEVADGYPGPEMNLCRNFYLIKQVILASKNKHYVRCMKELKSVLPVPKQRADVLKQIKDIKPLFEVEDEELIQVFIQSCIDTPVISDPTLNEKVVNLLKKYFDFAYMETLPFDVQQALGDFSKEEV